MKLTKLFLSRTNPETGQEERAHIFVPTCPLFDFDNRNRTEEFRAYEEAGWEPTGSHIDGEEVPS